MKPNPLPLIALLLLASIALHSQDHLRYAIQLKSGSIFPEKNITVEKLNEYNQRMQRTEQKAFAVIQFDNILTEPEKQQLKLAGIELLEYIPNFAYTVSISGGLDSTVLVKTGARAVVELSPEQKMEPLIAKNIFPSWAVTIPGTVDVWISFPKSFSFESVSQQLTRLNIEIIAANHKQYRILSLRVPSQRIRELATLPFIEYVQAIPHSDQLLLHKVVPNGRANVLNSSISGGRNLKGQGVVVGVGDNADPLRHVDFSGRLINRFSYTGGSHGVHVMGITGGAGIVNERFTGFAPKATIVSQIFSNILDNAPAYVQDFGMVITNNSYGSVVDDCNYHGLYDLTARILDQQALDMPELQQVFAAGNSGQNNCSPYPLGFNLPSLTGPRLELILIVVNSSVLPTDITFFADW